MWLLTPTAPNSPPRNYAGVALSSHSILLTWDPPPAEEQNGIITGYLVNITELETGESSTMFTESNNLTLYSLQPFSTYGFLVSAQTVAGRGPTTRLLSVTTQEEGLAVITCTTRNVKSIFEIFRSNHIYIFVCVCDSILLILFKLFIIYLTTAPIGEPTNVTVLFIGPTSIHISWDHPPEDTHYGMIREYHITYTELETGAVFNTSTDSETTQLAVDSLHPFYTYTFFIVPVTVDVGTNHTAITIRTAETGNIHQMHFMKQLVNLVNLEKYERLCTLMNFPRQI